MPRHRIIVNPTSGRGAGGAIVPDLSAELERLGLEFTLMTTEGPRHAIELARQAVIDAGQSDQLCTMNE